MAVTFNIRPKIFHQADGTSSGTIRFSTPTLVEKAITKKIIGDPTRQALMAFVREEICDSHVELSERKAKTSESFYKDDTRVLNYMRLIDVLNGLSEHGKAALVQEKYGPASVVFEGPGLKLELRFLGLTMGDKRVELHINGKESKSASTLHGSINELHNLFIGAAEIIANCQPSCSGGAIKPSAATLTEKVITSAGKQLDRVMKERIADFTRNCYRIEPIFDFTHKFGRKAEFTKLFDELLSILNDAAAMNGNCKFKVAINVSESPKHIWAATFSAEGIVAVAELVSFDADAPFLKANVTSSAVTIKNEAHWSPNNEEWIDLLCPKLNPHFIEQVEQTALALMNHHP